MKELEKIRAELYDALISYDRLKIDKIILYLLTLNFKFSTGKLNYMDKCYQLIISHN